MDPQMQKKSQVMYIYTYMICEHTIMKMTSYNTVKRKTIQNTVLGLTLKFYLPYCSTMSYNRIYAMNKIY
jgi:hypothetical protein